MKFMNMSKFSYKNYVRYLRRQSLYVQEIHALVFAASITLVVAGCILYYDYGFWHDVYVRTEGMDVVTVDTVKQEALLSDESPGEMISGFFSEAKTRFGSLGKEGVSLLQGKEVYTNTGK